MIWVKPLDEKLLEDILKTHDIIVTVEDGVAKGGFGTAVTEWLRDNGHSTKIITLGAPDSWVNHGTVAQLRANCGYDANGIASAVTELLRD